jgi:hypothetical protein
MVGARTSSPSLRGAHEVREPGIQMQAQRSFLDSGFAACGRAPE